jgi:hypothetical protein
MTTAPQRLRALSTKEFEELRTQEHAEFGQGFALYEKLGRQCNSIRNSGLDVLSNAQLRIDLTNAKAEYDHSRSSLAEALPSYQSYRKVINEYNDAVIAASTAASEPKVERLEDTDAATATPVAPRPSAPAPRPAPAPTQAAQPAPVVTSDPVPASQPAPVVERDDSVAPAWFNGFREEFAGKVNKHDATLYGEDGNAGLVADVADLQNWRREIDPDLPRNERGDYVPRTEWYNRTVTVAGRKFRYLPAVVAFVIAYLLLLLFMAPTWPDTGFWSSLYDWRKLLIAAIVFVVTLVLTNRNTSQTASAA